MTPKLNLMSMEELSDAATSQDGTEEQRETFKQALARREKQLFIGKTKTHAHFPACRADYILS